MSGCNLFRIDREMNPIPSINQSSMHFNTLSSMKCVQNRRALGYMPELDGSQHDHVSKTQINHFFCAYSQKNELFSSLKQHFARLLQCKIAASQECSDITHAKSNNHLRQIHIFHHRRHSNIDSDMGNFKTCYT